MSVIMYAIKYMETVDRLAVISTVTLVQAEKSERPVIE